ncbi:HYR domain-containing protein [Christiangramia salexigens]|uniref:HYR domain-containing protein n=1 Tax=Christiangramia salexigens TaxID=1913577 RepID=A0A1L3J1J4_9FLAO|nr:HYR domain-containing protein [Christiangramia salexigens]APG58996.1 hypothetical protein LPB144_00620 [Christiangramia salexigens]
MISATHVCLYKGSSKLKAWYFTVIFFLCALSSFGQDPEDVVPSYVFSDFEDLPTVSVSALNTDDLTIAIATGPQNFVYTLSFGKGVDKRNSDGSIVDGNFIDGLKNPLDIAVDKNGLVYIADFEASGETYEDNGQIKIYDQNGNYLRSILTSYFRPLGIDVDDENVYIAEYNDGNQGPERTPSSRIRIVNKTTGTAVKVNNNVVIPYRIAVDSKKNIYVSQAGNNDPAVLIFNQNLSNTGRLGGIQSPGSIVVDKFDFIHVIEYSGRIDFSRFINFNSLGLGDILDISHKIYHGIRDEAFYVKVFDAQGANPYDFKTEIDFPLDIAFDNCDKMYVDNSSIFGTHIDTFFVHEYLPSRLEFDLEIYTRTPAFDITPPEITCTADINVDAEDGNNYAIVNYTDPVVKEVCGYTLTRDGLASGSQFPVGESIVKFTATDSFGNVSNCEFKVTVNAGDQPPSFTNCSGDISQNVDSGKCHSIVNFPTPTATDENGAVNVVQTAGLTSGAEFPVGVTNIVFEATDDQGNKSSCSFNVTVMDSEAPKIQCPANIVESVAYGESGKVVNYDAPVFSDNCEINSINRTSGLASGSEFPVGVTTVTFIVEDAAGNKSNCSFTVEIKETNDTEAPVTSCPSPITKNSDAGECGALVSFPPATATDNAGDENVIITRTDNGPASGEFFPVGETIVSFKATDQSGNSSSCSFSINVLDNELPQANCVTSYSIMIDQDETRTISASDLDENSTDNCGVESINLSKTTFSSADEGFVEVDLIVKDINGNTAICKVDVEVIVREPEKPFSCKNSVTAQLDQNGNVQVQPEQFYTANGDTSGTSFSIDKEIFECSDLGNNTVTLTYSGDFNGSCEVTVMVLDTSSPVIQCPEDIIEFVAPGETSAQVVFDPAVATDNCSYTLEQTAGLDSGSQFPLGESIIEFTATDAAGNKEVCSFKVLVQEESDTAPVAQAEEYSITEGTTLEVSQQDGVLANDSDPNGDPLTAVLISDVSNGVLNLNPDGSFSYTPNDGFLATDSFTYVASDGSENSIEITVSISVLSAGNEPPVAEDDTYTIPQNTILVVDVPGVLENDYDPEGEALTTYLITSPENGTLVFNGDGSFTYTPNDGFTGVDSFVYYATDMVGEDEATVSITVTGSENTAPVGVDEEYSTSVNTALNISAENGVLANDTDAEGNALTAILDTDVSFGSLQLNEDGSFIYTPDPDFIGEDFFTYYANDGNSDSNIVFVSINVNSATNEFNCVTQLVLSLNADGEAQLEINDLFVGDADGLEFSVSQSVFTCEDLGENNISLSYSGLIEGSCEIVIVILDETPPVLNLRDIDIDLDLSANASISFEDIDNGSYDSCSSNVTYTLSKSDFRCKELGTNVIQVTAEDEIGNISTATVTVRVFAERGICSDPVPGSQYVFIYPNPNSGSFKIATPQDVIITRIEVFDHRGRFIKARDYNADDLQYSMHLGPLQEAVYVIKITTNKEELIRRMIFRN